MSDNSSNNNRIAKNSILLSIRMVFVLIISLYTTRVVLDYLGVEDYGIYNVVCGFVSLFAFLSTSISNGIQRFYNYELGKNGIVGAQKVYNTSLVIQIGLAVILLVAIELVGSWYINNKLVISMERMEAALCVFQFSLFSFVIVILQAPYMAAVLAHEKMGLYAYVSIYDAVLKLLIVYFIPYFPYDKLVVYGALFSFISVSDLLIYILYCKKQFPEIKIRLSLEKELLRRMLSFSGWNIFGSFANVMKEQGINIIMNLFVGPVVNAARGVAMQVNGGLMSFIGNLSMAVRPQVVQSYAQGNISRTMSLTYSISKLSSYILFLFSLPVLLEINFILHLWLGENVPDHTGLFVVIIVATSFVNNLNGAISGVVHATGKLKKYQIVGSIINLSAIPLSFTVLSFGWQPEWALIATLTTTTIGQIVSLFLLKDLVSFSIRTYFKIVLFPFLLVVFVSSIAPVAVLSCMDECFLRLIIITLVSVLSVMATTFVVGLDDGERNLVRHYITKYFKKK